MVKGKGKGGRDEDEKGGEEKENMVVYTFDSSPWDSEVGRHTPPPNLK